VCLILFCYLSHPEFRLILAANRDEYHARPSAPPEFWSEQPHLLAGRDLVAGGTWLGITRLGKIAAVTNYRDPASLKNNAPSRGRVVQKYLAGDIPPLEYLAEIQEKAEEYNGFNLLIGDRESFYWYSNRSGSPLKFSSGVFGISNHLLDTNWPKVVRGKEMLAGIVTETAPSPEELFRMLRDETPASDELLPSTGVTLERERMLAPIFIRHPVYGTRSSTIILVGYDDRVLFLDRSFGADQDRAEERRFEFSLGK